MSQSVTEKEYQAYLDNKHAEFQTDSNLVYSMVRQATGSDVVSDRRLVVGEENEVYDVATSDGNSVIVRISRKEEPRFAAEKWALDRCRSAGVPTPQVLLIEKVADKDHDLTFCIEEKLPGEPMGRFLQTASSAQISSTLIGQIGEALNRIHSIPVNGFGDLDTNGQGDPHMTWKDIMLDTTHKTWLPDVLNDTVGFSRGDTKKAFELLATHGELYEDRKAYLNHADLGLDHFLVHDGKLTGIIDFQSTGADPILDYAWLDFFWGNHMPVSQVAGEASGQPNFALHLELAKLRLALWMGQHYGQNGNHRGIEVVQDNFRRSMTFFENKLSR